MKEWTLISADSHIVEPPDLWVKRLDPKFREQAPRIVRQDGIDLWYVDDQKFGSPVSVSSAGQRFEDPENIQRLGAFEEVRKEGYDPHERIKDMEIDGVKGDVVYPSTGLRFFQVKDSVLLSAIFRVYNDWVAEYCSAYPDRLKGIAMINLYDVEEGVKELQMAAKLGLAGAMISVYPK